jgi:acyl carrier protein
VLAFRPFDAESVDTLRDMFAAKVDGAWRLHNLFADDTLDFFVLCSSTSTLLRSPLLGAYAAGNAFLDALAHHRRAKGLAALAVNWGTWGEVGMAVEGERSKGSLMQGMNTISSSNGLLALERLLGACAVQAAVMPVDWSELVRGYPAFATDPFLAALAAEVTHAPISRSAGSAASLVRDAIGDEQAALMLSYVRGEAARTLGMTTDRLDPALPLSSLGFDSLMAVQLKNQIEADFGVVLPMIQLLQGPSVEGLAPSILALLGDGPAAQRPDDDDSWEAGSI